MPVRPAAGAVEVEETPLFIARCKMVRRVAPPPPHNPLCPPPPHPRPALLLTSFFVSKGPIYTVLHDANGTELSILGKDGLNAIPPDKVPHPGIYISSTPAGKLRKTDCRLMHASISPFTLPVHSIHNTVRTSLRAYTGLRFAQSASPSSSTTYFAQATVMNLPAPSPPWSHAFHRRNPASVVRPVCASAFPSSSVIDVTKFTPMLTFISEEPTLY